MSACASTNIGSDALLRTEAEKRFPPATGLYEPVPHRGARGLAASRGVMGFVAIDRINVSLQERVTAYLGAPRDHRHYR